MTIKTPLEKAIANFKVAAIGLKVASDELGKAIVLPDTIEGLHELVDSLPLEWKGRYRIYREIIRLEDERGLS